MKIEELIRENIRNLTTYSSARDEFDGSDYIQLDANENPFNNGVNRYPDPYQTELKRAIAGYRGLNTENLLLGNGSDELIDLIIRVFCEPGVDNVIGLKPSYGMYRVCCDINNVDYREVGLDSNFRFNAVDVLNAIDTNTKLAFFCSPNNPTGNSLDKSEVEKFLAAFNGIVVIDEAYIDFSDKSSWTNSLSVYPQLVVIQTFSKAFGLASLRLGMAWASKQIIAVLNRIKPPYNVNGLTQKAGLDALQDLTITKSQVDILKRERDQLSKNLQTMKTVQKVFPSDANFLLVRFHEASEIYRYLLENKIVVRKRFEQFNCDNCLRISVGTPKENEQLINTLKIFENEKSIVYR
ncbi:MAG: histidinol-phosphate transaminase [Crocinitomicaceae bacterium]|nr:histidinol-phosphate transaminase [Crocinitomicaceae bacterium]